MVNAVVKNRSAGSGLSCPQEGPGTRSCVSGGVTDGTSMQGFLPGASLEQLVP